MGWLRHLFPVGLILVAACSSEPRFSEVSPNTGAYTGGEEIEIRGNNFPRTGVVVRFGTKEAGSVAILNERLIKAVSPPGDKGTAVDVILIFDDGRALALKRGFHYVDATQRETMEKFFNKAAGDKK
ncbi:MAG TPA: IPT/TIG domain-containing protein [Polyangia bacterium]|jgi:hypothetical protein|nr:IPT/TIG domain-containing protein [Polyangia bacterium]